MKFSIAALSLVAALGLAAPAYDDDYDYDNRYDNYDDLYDNRYDNRYDDNDYDYDIRGVDQSNYQWPQSDYMYQMQAQRGYDQRNMDMRTDGRNLYFGQGDYQNVNGTPLKTVNIFVDVKGDINVVHNHNSDDSDSDYDHSHQAHHNDESSWDDRYDNRYVGVDNGRLALSDRRSDDIDLQRSSDDRVSWRHNSDQQQFQACPVDQYGRAYDLSYDQQSNDHLYQVFTGQQPCANPIAVTLNGNRMNGRSQYQNSQLRVVDNQQFRDSNIVNNDGRLMLVDGRQNYNNNNINNNYDQFRGQLSYRGQLVDNQGRFVQLGNQASMRFTDRNQVRQGLTGFNYRNNRLTYQNQGFIACQVQNGMWELRPAGAEGAAAACNNAQYVQISMEPLN